MYLAGRVPKILEKYTTNLKKHQQNTLANRIPKILEKYRTNLKNNWQNTNK